MPEEFRQDGVKLDEMVCAMAAHIDRLTLQLEAGRQLESQADAPQVAPATDGMQPTHQFVRRIETVETTTVYAHEDAADPEVLIAVHA